MRQLYLCVLCVGCGTVVVEHGDDVEPPPAGISASGGVSGPVAPESPSAGNYPDPAVTRCGGLPQGVQPMKSLTSAFGVRALPGAVDANGDAVAPGSLRLRLADHAMFDCAEEFFALVDPCSDTLYCPWGVGLTLTPDEQQPGIYPLVDLIDPSYEVAPENEDAPLDLAAGELEIFWVSPGCIAGAFRDVAAHADGGFVAEVCDRQCVPTTGMGC